jgi:hypothetical protein
LKSILRGIKWAIWDKGHSRKSLLNAEIVTGTSSFVVTSGISFMRPLQRQKRIWWLEFGQRGKQLRSVRGTFPIDTFRSFYNNIFFIVFSYFNILIYLTSDPKYIFSYILLQIKNIYFNISYFRSKKYILIYLTSDQKYILIYLTSDPKYIF